MEIWLNAFRFFWDNWLSTGWAGDLSEVPLSKRTGVQIIVIGLGPLLMRNWRTACSFPRVGRWLMRAGRGPTDWVGGSSTLH